MPSGRDDNASQASAAAPSQQNSPKPENKKLRQRAITLAVASIGVASLAGLLIWTGSCSADCFEGLGESLPDQPSFLTSIESVWADFLQMDLLAKILTSIVAICLVFLVIRSRKQSTIIRLSYRIRRNTTTIIATTLFGVIFYNYEDFFHGFMSYLYDVATIFRDGDREKIKDEAEAFTFALAFITSIATMLYLYLRSRLNLRERRQNTRNWVMYNVMNRMNQDLVVLEITYNRVLNPDNNPVYNELYKKIFNESRNDISNNAEMARWRDPHPIPYIPDVEQHIPIEDHDAWRKTLSELHSILLGFSNCWSNDDVLSAQLAFDFSLLHNIEQRRALSYFENYNSLQDLINVILPFLEKAVKDKAGFSSRSLLKTDKIFYELARRLGEASALARTYHRIERLNGFYREVAGVGTRARKELGLNLNEIGRRVQQEEENPTGWRDKNPSKTRLLTLLRPWR